jgi:hypothetical protein
MKPDKLTVHDLFQKERRYVVPLYQRSYVWTREDQWEPLWEDIERQAEACLEAENHVARRSHFLGAIVLNVAKIVGSSVARSEIIDGQQRLTTLQLFLAALRDYAAEIGSAMMRTVPDAVVVAWLDRQPAESVWITSITVFEAHLGLAMIPQGRRRQRLEAALHPIRRQ